MSAPDTAAPASLRVTRLIKTDPDRVFRAWTDPDQLRSWFGPPGANVTDARIDLRPGGTYLLRIETPDGDVHTARGTYREIDPPMRLAFTWDWEEEAHAMGVETLVTIQLVEQAGGTEVIITHEQFPNAEAARHHEQGWNACLDGLQRHLP